MRETDFIGRIARFIRLQLIVNVGLTLAAVLGYLRRPETMLLFVCLVWIADTAFLWPYGLLARRGHGEAATYASLGLSAVGLAASMHLAGGFGTALGAIYGLLVLTGGLVTELAVGAVVMAGISTLVYLVAAGLEYSGVVPVYLERPPTVPLALAAVAGTLISIWGAALVSITFWRRFEVATAGLRRAVAEEQERAAESACLLAEQRERLAQQSDLIETVYELSTLVVPLVEGIIALPLVGRVDEARAHRILDDLLTEVARRRPRAVLLDVTGMVDVDQVTVDHLAQMAQGVRLLGADVILVGVQASLAETMADLGLDTTQMTTQRDMQSGIAYALAQADQKMAMMQWSQAREG